MKLLILAVCEKGEAMFKKKRIKILAKVLLFITLLFTVPVYASEMTGTIKVFFLDGLSARVYKIGTYNTKEVFTLSDEFKDLKAVEEREIESYLAAHQEVKGDLYTAAKGEFIISGLEKGTYYLTLVQNKDYRMNGILIHMPMQVSENGIPEWFYEIEPKFEKKPQKPGSELSSDESLSESGPEKVEIPTIQTDQNETDKILDDEVPRAQKDSDNDKGGLHISKTGDTLGAGVLAVMLISAAYIIWYLKRKLNKRNSSQY